MGLRPMAVIGIAALASACASPAVAAPSTATGPQHVVTGVSRANPSPAASAGAGALTALIELGDHWYLPAQLTVQVGTTVTWKMVGSQEHDVWATDGSFHSPTLNPGMSYSYTFTRPGVYRYFCVPHYGDGMAGSVTVVERR
ncbi:MAG: cupredoxin domain-containing protein [Actinobacteria bacterium]|nr:cupredoxin domain-containing protein [Actinomycetota bacterium]